MEKSGAILPAKWSLNNSVLRAVAICIALFLLLISLFELKKVDVPNVPVGWIYGSVILSLAAFVVQLPQVFSRLPRFGRIGATLLLLAGIIVAQVEAQLVDPIWLASPAYAKEIADKATSDRAEAAEQAKRDERAKAEKAAAESEEAESKRESAEAEKPNLCNAMSKQVVDGTKVFEVNNVVVDTNRSGEFLSCSGDAITSAGPHRVEFGLINTPQGQQLLSMHWPD